jgi:SNF2 family DNA or RNA helicase
MIQLKYGSPKSIKQKVFAILGDTFQHKNFFNLLGFNYNPIEKFWFRKTFNPHIVDAIKKIAGPEDVDISNAVWGQYNSCLQKPERIFPYTLKYDMLLNYQKEALEFLQKAGNGIIAYDIGIGKTICALSYAEDLGIPALVVCPASLRYQWYSELTKFTNSPESLRSVIDDSPKKRAQLWEDSIGKNQYNICSYDLLRQDKDLEYAQRFAKNGMIIFDEIMRIKTRSSERTKAAKKLRSVASYCVGLTGTPIENNLAEFYEVLNIVSPGFISSYEKFAEMFLERELKTTYGGKTFWVITGEKNLDDFTKLVSPLFIRKEKRECLELPPASTVVRRVPMSKKQRQIEKELLNLSRVDSLNVLKYFTYARENTISPDLLNSENFKQKDNSLNLFEEEFPTERFPSKIELVMSGELEANELEMTPRLQETKDIIEETGREKIIIYSTYVKALNIISRLCLPEKESFAMIAGDCNVEEELAKFRQDNTRILLASPKIEEGLNIQFASMLLTVNKNFNPARQSQLEGRIERSGQKNAMTFFELESTDSVVESKVNAILQKKEKLSEKVLARRVME